nr:C40 family peptidase [Corynebacterium sp. TAE3-ERU12]
MSKAGSQLADVGVAPAVEVADWTAVADVIADSFTGDAGEVAASALHHAARAAAILDSDSSTIDSALAEGASLIAAASAELAEIAARCAVDYARNAALALNPVSALGAMLAAAETTVRAATQAQAVVSKLQADLAGPTAALTEVAQRDAAVPATPTPLPTGSVDPATGQVETDAPATDTDAGVGAPTPQAQQAVANALSAVGTPYVWGGNTPGAGFDCSGLTHWAYGQAGVDIPRTAAAQAVGTQVGPNELLPGDLVVWDGHVAMVVGDGQMVEAGDPVQVNPIRTSNMGMGFLGFWRPTG